jgi:hypothetical protein
LPKFEKPQLKHVRYGASMTAMVVVAVMAVVAPMGMECLAAGTSVPSPTKESSAALGSTKKRGWQFFSLRDLINLFIIEMIGIIGRSI